jgi:hypothetical protein
LRPGCLSRSGHAIQDGHQEASDDLDDPEERLGDQGLEYDWLGSDESGCVALFSTAGAGYAPQAFLHDTDAHDIAIEAVLALPPSTAAMFAPDLGPGLTNTWRLVAERGLYAYDCHPNGGPYRLVAAPAIPARIGALPAAVAKVASAVRCSSRFASHRVISEEQLT